MNIDTIEKRKSVRTFKEEDIPEELIENIKNYIEKIDNPFGVDVEFKLLSKEKDKVSSPVIIGEEFYVAAKVKKIEKAEIAFGYSFEKFVLHATDLGLGTVWLAATIDRKAFEESMNLQSDEIMPAVSPIGYAAKKRSMRESLMRKGLKSDSRIDFEELFFLNDFAHPFSEKNSSRLKKALETVQKSPSATNKQPWRIVVEGSKIHFFEKRSSGLANKEGDIQKVDLGIAMCHFEIAARELGMNGKYIYEEPKFELPNNTEYMATFEII